MSDIHDLVNEIVANIEPEEGEEPRIVLTVKPTHVEVAFEGLDEAFEQDVQGSRLMTFKSGIFTIAVGIDAENGVENAE